MNGVARAPGQWLLPVAALVGAPAVGAVATQSPAAAAGLVGAVAVATGVALAGEQLIVRVALAILPWLVVLDALVPSLLKTFVAAGAVIALLLVAAPARIEQRPVAWGACLFLLALAIGVVDDSGSEQVLEASKFAVFAAAAVAVTSRPGRELLASMRGLLIASGLGAMAFHLVVLTAGLGEHGTYYGESERLGFATAGQGPHELSLLAVIVAAAGLAGTRRAPAQVAYLSLAAIPALSTGVRATLLAFGALLAVFLFRSRLSPRALAVVAGAVALTFATGAANVVLDRIESAPQRSPTLEGLDASTAGRVSIWTTSIERWAESGPEAWVLGSGLGSVRQFTHEGLGGRFVAHSDLVAVGVDLGLLGLAGWLLLWAGLLRARLSALLLAPIAVYAAVNGALEYVGPVVFGLALAAACGDRATRSGSSA